MRAFALVLPLCALLAACNSDADSSGGQKQASVAAQATPSASPTDPFAAQDPATGSPLDPALADDQPRPVMQLQVVLDRLGFTPGVVDGKNGLSTRNAIAGFQESRGLPVTGQADDATRQALAPWANIPATRIVTIPADFAAGPYAPLPPKPADQAKLDWLGYQSLDEALAERFHTTAETLKDLNPGQVAGTSSGSPSTGQRIRVPNIGADRVDAGTADEGWRKTLASLGVASAQPKAEKLVVSKSKGTLKAFDAAGKLVGMYTATMGSRHDPLPLGKWKVLGIAHNPDFAFDPELFWDVPDSAAKQRLPPGPNGPVGVVWIDLNKEHYGIHGTPEPATIGRAQSHGCVRLTNWDAARLAQMVKPGTQVSFES